MVVMTMVVMTMMMTTTTISTTPPATPPCVRSCDHGVLRYDSDHELRLLTRYLLDVSAVPDVQELGLAVCGV